MIDALSATATATFSLTVNSAVTATQSIATVALTQSKAVTAFTPVTGSGGTAPLSYGVSPALPAGLSFSTTTGAVTGTPTATSVATTYTVTVTDTNNASAANTFILTVNTAVTATQSVASKTLEQGIAVTSFTPVTGGGGTGSLSYGISPTLPAGLSFSTTNGAVSGTPTATSTSTTYTVTVTDQNGATASNSFALAVNSALAASTLVPSTTLTQDRVVTPFTPVGGTGGVPPLTYSVSPGLPAGLSFNTATGAITGTPSVTSAAASYTVTVTDSTSATATASFSLTVNPAVTATQSVASTTLTQNKAATTFTPVTGGGGTGALTYAVSPGLPAGLSFNTSSGAVSGTPSAASAATTYTVTVTDTNGASASNTFALTVNTAVTATQQISSASVTVGHAVTVFTPVTGSGGTGALTYAVSPSLPAGLSFNTTNGAVSGTPTTASAQATYTVTVTDTNGASASNTFGLIVNGAVTATQSIPATSLTQNRAVTSFVPVTGSGGTAPLSYSVSPALPTGLSFSTTTGAITGTPTATRSAATFTVTVTDANSATATNTFSLTVNGAVTATQSVASTTLTQNKAATTFTPVTGGGGTGALTYAISPSLPAGLSFNIASGAVSGTPTAASTATTYTVTVTDTNSASASNTFALAVNTAVTATTAIPTTTLVPGRTVTSFTPVTGSGGTGALTYGVSPTLPAGLNFNTSTGAITGLPTTPSPAATYTVLVTDSNGASASATFSLAVSPVATTVALTSSPNPSSAGQAVTFTATVSGSGGTPTGTVTFYDGSTVIGTATLSSGVATLAISSLKTGGHSITAVYGGNGTFAASTSAVLAQTVNIPADSVKLRAMQVAVTKMVAQSSGQAISGAIDDAIAEGFADNSAFVTPSQSSVRFNFAADPFEERDTPGGTTADTAKNGGMFGGNAYSADNGSGNGGGGRGRGSSRIDDAFAAMNQQMPTKAPPKRLREEKHWLFWIDVRTSGLERQAATTGAIGLITAPSPLRGEQVNALAGLTYKMSPEFPGRPGRRLRGLQIHRAGHQRQADRRRLDGRLLSRLEDHAHPSL